VSSDESAPGNPEAGPTRGVMEGRPSRRRTALLALAVFGCWAAPAHALAQSVRGRVVDSRTAVPVPNALVQLGLSEHYGVTDDEGRFEVKAPGESGTHTLIITAPGYAKRYEPWELGAGGDLTIRLVPQPIDLGEVEASVVPYRARTARRLNALSLTDTSGYALEGPLLERSTAENVWDLVRTRHGFHFEGFSDFGCPVTTIDGIRAHGELFIDDRPVRIGIFRENPPQFFTRVEVIDHGRIIRAYTQEYLDWMTENEKQAVPFSMIPGLCPPGNVTPGTIERGRRVGSAP